MSPKIINIRYITINYFTYKREFNVVIAVIRTKQPCKHHFYLCAAEKPSIPENQRSITLYIINPPKSRKTLFLQRKHEIKSTKLQSCKKQHCSNLCPVQVGGDICNQADSRTQAQILVPEDQDRHILTVMRKISEHLWNSSLNSLLYLL